MYFSTAPVPRDHDPEQLRLLNEYREPLKPNILYWTFDSTEELYRLISRHLARSVSRLYQELRASRAIGVLASQLPGIVSGAELIGEAAPERKRSADSFTLQYVSIGEFPDGPRLRLTASRKFSLIRLDYLDENGARVASDSNTPEYSKLVEGKGEMLEAPVDHAKLIQIHNLKPRTRSEAIPMQFRLHLMIDDSLEETKTVPALLQPSFKTIGGATTYFMKMRKDNLPRVFISQASSDKPFARRVAIALRKSAISPWIDKEEVLVGDDVLEKLGEGLRMMDLLIFVVSRKALRSRWVDRELKFAARREIEERQILILPFIIDSTSSSELPWYLQHLRAERVPADKRGVAAILESVTARVSRRAVRINRLSHRLPTLTRDPRVDRIIANVGLGEWKRATTAALRVLKETNAAGKNQTF